VSDKLERGAASGPEPYDADIDDFRDGDLDLNESDPGLWGKLEGYARSRSGLVLAGVLGLCVVGAALGSSMSLTAGLRGALPARIVGIEPAPENIRADASASQSARDAVRVSVGGGEQRMAQTVIGDSSGPRLEAVGGGGDYLPDTPTASTVITVPASQGRLLRFDEAVESVFIADPTIADVRVVSSDLVYVYGKSLGLTNLMAVSARTNNPDGTQQQQQVTASALLRVVVDPRPSKEAQQQWAPSAPVDINVFGRRMAVRGHMQGIDQALAAANIAETYSPRDQPPINATTLAGPNQINIRVRFAEASRNDLRSFGIDWSVSNGNFSVGVANGAAARGGTPNLSAKGKIGSFEIDVLIEALQNSGALSILAEPNLTAVTGETASFLAGGEVPIPVPTGNNSESITVQYKPFGVSLAFTPTMVKQNRIALKVKPEVSSIADNVNFGIQGFNLPSFTVRRAETTVEMASGQTFAMAGLFQRDITRNVDKMPLLGDVPVLGQLFRSERYQRNETELVILITPYLVEPVSDKSLATPLDRAGPSPWQAEVVDPTGKGATLTGAGRQSGFIMK
jgi:pilus assembly protein CpaC